MILNDLGELGAERAVARADHDAAGGDAVRLGDGCGMGERLVQAFDLRVEVRVQRQLLRYDERRDQHHVRPPVGREPAREVECMLSLGPAEQRHDDAAVAEQSHRTW